MLKCSLVIMISAFPKALFASITSKFYSFKNSLLLYPLILSAGSIVLFILTSILDQALNNITIDTPVLDSLLFAGSSHAARSILSTIAAGWATILGVAFSITLISLQLSITKHTAEVIDEFENDRLNQVMLGWFISTVIYSLLVLKTVRTGEGDLGSITFTPLIGVNVAIFMAVVGLFLFVMFLHNIGSYIKPNLLVGKITKHIINSLQNYDKRYVDRRLELAGKITKNKIADIQSPRNGLLRRVKIEELTNNFKNLSFSSGNVWIEFDIPVGSNLMNNTIVASIYTDGNDLKFNHQSERSLHGNSNNTDKKPLNDDSFKQLESYVLNSLDISDDRDIFSDPEYGIEILRNMVVKSINQADINLLGSGIQGLFEVIFHAIKVSDLQSLPIRITRFEKEHKNQKQSLGEELGEKNKYNTRNFMIFLRLKERVTIEVLLFELEYIYRSCMTSDYSLKSYTAGKYIEQFYLLSRHIIAEDKITEFEKLTNWYSSKILQHSIQFIENSEEMRKNILSNLESLEKDLIRNYPYCVNIFNAHFRTMIDKLK